MSPSFSNKFWPFSFYLLFFCSAAAIFTYLALFFQSKGLPDDQIGVLMGVSSLVGLVAGPFWSGVADSTGRHRLVLSLGILCSIIAVFLYPYANAFLTFLALVVVQAVFGGQLLPMVDNATVTMLGEEKEKYGRVRLGGTIGWGLMAIVMGLIVERTGLRWNFVIYCAFLALALLVAQKLRFSPRRSQAPLMSGVRQLLGDRKWLAFLTIAFIAGCGNAAITVYLFPYLAEIGTTPTWMGISIAIATIAEVPAFVFADRLLRRLGPRGLLTLGLAATAVRCILYGVISVPAFALGVQVLQLVTFPILLVAGVSYADQNAPPGMGATAQSIFGSAFMGFGFAAGGYLGGVLMKYIGAQHMFFVFGALILLATVIFLVGQRRRVPAAQPA